MCMHINVVWSAAPLAGLEDFDFKDVEHPSDGTEPTEGKTCLALLRYVLDPQRKRRQFGG